MKTLLELVTAIVAAHASTNSMSSDELVLEIGKVHNALKSIEARQSFEGEIKAEAGTPTLTVRQAFKKDEVICMVCGKGGMKTIARHIMKAHGMKPGEYRIQFGIPRSQPLAAKAFSESRRKMAEERGLADVLAKAREVRAAKSKPKAAAKAKTTAKEAKPAAKVPAKNKAKTTAKGRSRGAKATV